MQNILKNSDQIRHIFRVIILLVTPQYVVVKGVGKKHKICWKCELNPIDHYVGDSSLQYVEGFPFEDPSPIESNKLSFYLRKEVSRASTSHSCLSFSMRNSSTQTQCDGMNTKVFNVSSWKFSPIGSDKLRMNRKKDVSRRLILTWPLS